MALGKLNDGALFSVVPCGAKSDFPPALVFEAAGCCVSFAPGLLPTFENKDEALAGGLPAGVVEKAKDGADLLGWGVVEPPCVPEAGAAPNKLGPDGLEAGVLLVAPPKMLLVGFICSPAVEAGVSCGFC